MVQVRIVDYGLFGDHTFGPAQCLLGLGDDVGVTTPPPSDGGSQVCGSDGVTYDNGCKLQVENCRLHRNVTVKHMGQCSELSLTGSGGVWEEGGGRRGGGVSWG